MEDFWPFYISQHMSRANRRLHFAGTSFGLAFVAASALLRQPWLLAAGLVGAYGLAWWGHFFVERNRPATFSYPWLSFRADFRMYRLMLVGGMEPEIIRLKHEILKYR